ncbi:MAG: hypothetical protein ACLTSZ_03070 [Lachnospiraceae bacterium]
MFAAILLAQLPERRQSGPNSDRGFVHGCFSIVCGSIGQTHLLTPYRMLQFAPLRNAHQSASSLLKKIKTIYE